MAPEPRLKDHRQKRNGQLESLRRTDRSVCVLSRWTECACPHNILCVFRLSIKFQRLRCLHLCLTSLRNRHRSSLPHLTEGEGRAHLARGVEAPALARRTVRRGRTRAGGVWRRGRRFGTFGSAKQNINEMREEINHPLERGGRGRRGRGEGRRIIVAVLHFRVTLFCQPIRPSMIRPIVRPPLRHPSIRVQGLGSEFARAAKSKACM